MKGAILDQETTLNWKMIYMSKIHEWGCIALGCIDNISEWGSNELFPNSGKYVAYETRIKSMISEYVVDLLTDLANSGESNSEIYDVLIEDILKKGAAHEQKQIDYNAS